MVLERDRADMIAELPAPQDCRHHWVIESANGSVSQGECQICHQVKEFSNSIIETETE
jgi:hypothetical protein